ncbi:MAG: hypothetical protein ACRDY0_05670 [Acidimicrobiales bacterium]
MTADIALAVVLVIAVAGMSLAMQTQRPTPPARPPRPAAGPRRPVRERRGPSPSPSPPAETPPDLYGPKSPELLRSGVPAEAKVVAVVDERTTGSIVRSRLSLKVEPAGTDSFEVQVRHAFQSPAARAKVKVGSTIAVRYDPDDHAKVVIVPEE